jgi:hypothetical protein
MLADNELKGGCIKCGKESCSCFLEKENIVYVYPKVEKNGEFYYVDYVKKVKEGLQADYFEFDFLYQAEDKLAELTLEIGG